MLIDRAHASAKRSRLRIVLEGAIALAGILVAFYYTAQMRSPPAQDDPSILEADSGNVMTGLKFDGRDDFGEIEP